MKLMLVLKEELHIRSSFKTFPEFAGILYRNSLIQFTRAKFMSHTLIRHFRDAVSRKRPEKWRTKSSFLLHDNAPAHRSVLVKDLSKNNVATVQHPPYSPELVPADLYLVSLLKSALKRRRFCNNNDIIKDAMEELKKSFHKMASRNVLSPLQSLTEVYIWTRRIF